VSGVVVEAVLDDPGGGQRIESWPPVADTHDRLHCPRALGIRTRRYLTP
jgi:hypothetical protein